MKIVGRYIFLLGMLAAACVNAADIAYIHGDVSAAGAVPSGSESAYDQMLLGDTGRTGLSQFKALLESQGHNITEHYDQQTSLNENFFAGLDVVIFGLHQKLWNASEKTSLDGWLRAGGGMLIYSDSASGGLYSVVGAQNSVGQTVTNNLISQYGMQVTVDQANGTKAFRSGPFPSNELMVGRPELEGEGVSPIAVASGDTSIEVLIPYSDAPDHFVSGSDALPHTQNISISDPVYAGLALKTLDQGHILVMFDRQPMWNDGPGSSINKRDNREILRRLLNFLALPAATLPPINPNPNPQMLGFLPTINLLLDD